MMQEDSELQPFDTGTDDSYWWMLGMKNPIQFLVTVILMASLTTVATVLFVIPFIVTSGYFNLGDAMVMISGLLLGPIGGFIAGGVGSSIGDVILGYSHFAPITFFVKGCEGLVVGLFAMLGRGHPHGRLADMVGLVLGSVVMMYGYLLAETLLYGFEAALLELILVNSIQTIVGALVAGVVGPTVRRHLEEMS